MYDSRLIKQLALDYCATEEQVLSTTSSASIFKRLKGQRRYDGDTRIKLKVASFHGKLLITGEKKLVEYFAPEWLEEEASWFMEIKNLSAINQELETFGCQIEQCHLFFVCDKVQDLKTLPYSLKFIEKDAVLDYEEDDLSEEAFSYSKYNEDLFGYGLMDGEHLIGLVGASQDGTYFSQIGIHIAKEYEGQHLGTELVKITANTILEKGLLPFYGTAISHQQSLSVAYQAGFTPAFAELTIGAIK